MSLSNKKSERIIKKSNVYHNLITTICVFIAIQKYKASFKYIIFFIFPSFISFIYRINPMPDFSIAEHFDRYFKILHADTDELKNHAYKIRYDVYCDELKYAQKCTVDRETDCYDSNSYQVLLQHRASGFYAGCVRLVKHPDNNPEALFPYEEYCMESIYPEKYEPLLKAGKQHIGEISRLAVHAMFRRRSGEYKTAYGINMDVPLTFNSDELRFFPFISISLYLASAMIAIHEDIEYVVVMMEPRLARLLNRFGICFMQIGEAMEYHGTRAMFAINKQLLFDNLKPELMALYQMISRQLEFDKSLTNV